VQWEIIAHYTQTHHVIWHWFCYGNYGLRGSGMLMIFLGISDTSESVYSYMCVLPCNSTAVWDCHSLFLCSVQYTRHCSSVLLNFIGRIFIKEPRRAQWYSTGLQAGWSVFQVLAGSGNSLHHHIQAGSGAHPASYPMGTRGSFPGDKASRVWSWPLTPT
jgi:hypothetical protein